MYSTNNLAPLQAEAMLNSVRWTILVACFLLCELNLVGGRAPEGWAHGIGQVSVAYVTGNNGPKVDLSVTTSSRGLCRISSCSCGTYGKGHHSLPRGHEKATSLNNRRY